MNIPTSYHTLNAALASSIKLLDLEQILHILAKFHNLKLEPFPRHLKTLSEIDNIPDALYVQLA